MALWQRAQMPRFCILGPDAAAELVAPEVERYTRLFGEDLVFRPWSEAQRLDDFALVMPLLAWGYHRDPNRWFAALDAWQAAGVRLGNSAPLLRWNSDKAYLTELASGGVNVVPTRAASTLSATDLEAARAAFSCATLIVKPPLSAGADHTYRLDARDELPGDAAGRPMLIQPLMQAIATEGEFSLFYFDGAFSHAIVKRAAADDFRVQSQFGGREESVAPPAQALTCATETLAALGETPLYARVDMVRDGSRFALMELELIEPALFLNHAADGGAAFANAVRKR